MRLTRYVIVPLLILGFGTLSFACSGGQTQKLHDEYFATNSVLLTSWAFDDVGDLYRMVMLGSDSGAVEKQHPFSDASVLADLQARKTSGGLASYEVNSVTFPDPGQLIDFDCEGTGSRLEATASVIEYSPGSSNFHVYEYHLSLVSPTDGTYVFRFESYRKTN